MMNLISLTLTFATAGFAPVLASPPTMEVPTDISQKNKPSTIKILLAHQKEQALLEAKGDYLIYNATNGRQISSDSSNKRAFIIPTSNGLKWDQKFSEMDQLRIVPANAQTTLLLDGIEYKGCMEIHNVNGKLEIINEIDIDRYLKSCLTFQFPNELDEDVMDAIAIVARTNAHYLINRNQHALWHVTAQEIGYQGYALTLQNIHVDRAVDNTKNIVLTYKEEPFAATWTQDSAGKTAAFATIFRKAISAPHGVTAPFAARDRAKHTWSFTLSKNELSQLINANNITHLDLYQDKESEKVYAVRIQDSKGSRDLDFFSLQKAIGPNRLCSNDFSVKLNQDKFTFSGYGEGCGVGLCLYSATIMAEHGANAQKILTSFFPDTKLQNLRDIGMQKK
jgi:stage II sporulation protein D